MPDACTFMFTTVARTNLKLITTRPYMYVQYAAYIVRTYYIASNAYIHSLN